MKLEYLYIMPRVLKWELYEPECMVLNTEMPLTEVEAIELEEATERQTE